LLDADSAVRVVELDDPVPLGITHGIGEHAGPRGESSSLRQLLGEAVAVEDVVAEHEGAIVAADEATADDERLREPIGRRLNGVAQIESPLRPIAQCSLKEPLLMRRRDDEDV